MGVYKFDDDWVEICLAAEISAQQTWAANGWPEDEAGSCLAKQAIRDNIVPSPNASLDHDTRKVDTNNIVDLLQNAIDRRRSRQTGY